MNELILILIAHFLHNASVSLLNHHKSYGTEFELDACMYADVYRKLAFLLVIIVFISVVKDMLPTGLLERIL